MDIKCKICGEPWDADYIHESIAEDISYDAVKAMSQEMYEKEFYIPRRDDFYKRGCEAFGGVHGPNRANPAISVLYEAFGNDLDGVAAEMEDFGL